MMLKGKYFNGLVSKAFIAEVEVIDSEMVLTLPENVDEQPPKPAPVVDMIISSRLDSVPRSLRFPGGQLFQCDDNDAVDELLIAHGLDITSTVAHRLESYLPLVVFSLIFVLASCGAFYHYGIPVIANKAADIIPESLEVTMSENVLEQFSNSNYFIESQIEESSQARLRQYLETFNPPNISTNILFRDSPIFGANAFALPGGTIVITDELVKLADYDEELLAIYLHEIGHVNHKHLLKQGLRSSLLTLMIMAVTGDATAATDLVSLLPTMLISLSYSREFETDSDQYALAQLELSNIDTVHFANVMRKLLNTTTKDNSFFISGDYLSTHPAPEDRIAYIGDLQPLSEMRKSIALFRNESVARFEGNWRVIIVPDEEIEHSDRNCAPGESFLAIKEGELVGDGRGPFEHSGLFKGSVDTKGEIYWRNDSEAEIYFEFNGTLLESSGNGLWRMLSASGELENPCEGVWTMSLIEADLGADIGDDIDAAE